MIDTNPKQDDVEEEEIEDDDEMLDMEEIEKNMKMA